MNNKKNMKKNLIKKKTFNHRYQKGKNYIFNTIKFWKITRIYETINLA